MSVKKVIAVMQMLSVITLKEATTAHVGLVSLAMEMIVTVSIKRG